MAEVMVASRPPLTAAELRSRMTKDASGGWGWMDATSALARHIVGPERCPLCASLRGGCLEAAELRDILAESMAGTLGGWRMDLPAPEAAVMAVRYALECAGALTAAGA